MVKTRLPSLDSLALRLGGAVPVEVVQLREAVAAGGGQAERHVLALSAQLHGAREHGHGWKWNRENNNNALTTQSLDH